MKREFFATVGVLLSAAAISASRDQRADLLPKLQPGQTLTYLIRFRSDKNVKTESALTIPLAPADSKADTRALLRILASPCQKTPLKSRNRSRSPSNQKASPSSSSSLPMASRKKSLVSTRFLPSSSKPGKNGWRGLPWLGRFPRQAQKSVTSGKSTSPSKRLPPSLL
jgi:hypothetical protein